MSNGTDAFFEEMLRAATSKARRNVTGELKSLKAENRALVKKVSNLEAGTSDVQKKAKAFEAGKKTHERQMTAREKEVNLAVKEIALGA